MNTATKKYTRHTVEHRHLNSGAQQEDSIIYIAAMHAGSTLYDMIHHRLNDFSTCAKKPFFVYSEILCPANYPLWCQDRSILWNNLETTSKGKNIPIAVEIMLSLPPGLEKDNYIELTKQMATTDLVEKSLIVDVSTHLSRSNDPHAHFLLPLFVPNESTFTLNKVDINLTIIEEKWQSIINNYSV